jgi:hypothetical protein
MDPEAELGHCSGPSVPLVAGIVYFSIKNGVAGLGIDIFSDVCSALKDEGVRRK